MDSQHVFVSVCYVMNWKVQTHLDVTHLSGVKETCSLTHFNTFKFKIRNNYYVCPEKFKYLTSTSSKNKSVFLFIESVFVCVYRSVCVSAELIKSSFTTLMSDSSSHSHHYIIVINQHVWWHHLKHHDITVILIITITTETFMDQLRHIWGRKQQPCRHGNR